MIETIANLGLVLLAAYETVRETFGTFDDRVHIDVDKVRKIVENCDRKCFTDANGAQNEVGEGIDKQDIDDYFYSLCEVETTANSSEDIGAAQTRIQKQIDLLGLAECPKASSKLMVYLERYKPHHYKALVEIEKALKL